MVSFDCIDFGSPESLRWPNVGKYKVDVASFESLALPELQVSSLSLNVLLTSFPRVLIKKLKKKSIFCENHRRAQKSHGQRNFTHPNKIILLLVS